VVAAYPGPVITRFEIEPATGVKGSQIVNLARTWRAAVADLDPRGRDIPGKTYMGLELPNAKRQIVRLSEILGSKAYHDMHSQLTVALGKDIAGSRWWPTWPRCRTCWWPVPPVRASRWASTR
jgi:S-DNA-T family DNA segregation ATPase FtsK/SpoIIIE